MIKKEKKGGGGVTHKKHWYARLQSR
jgi:hypothetical protein